MVGNGWDSLMLVISRFKLQALFLVSVFIWPVHDHLFTREIHLIDIRIIART